MGGHRKRRLNGLAGRNRNRAARIYRSNAVQHSTLIGTSLEGEVVGRERTPRSSAILE